MRYRRAAILCSILGSVAIPAAEAALPPYVYEQARDQATYHLQIKVTNVTPPAKTPGECETSGEVVRIFRDRSGALRLGARLAFAVSCSRRGEPPIVGGVLWTDYDALMRAKYLEVFLNRENGRYQVALWQSRIIEAPTDKPVMGPASAAPPADQGSRAAAVDPYDEGMRLYNAKQDRASIPYFDRAIAANPGRAEAYAGRGMAYHALGECPRAIEDFSAAIRLKPDWYEPYIYRGKSYRNSRQPDRAIEEFTAAARVNPQQVAMIPAVQRWQAEFLQWYREIQRDAARTRDDLCGVKYAGHAGRIQNWRSNGMNDTEDRIRKGAPGF